MRRLVIALLLVLSLCYAKNSEAQTIQYVYSAVTHNITTTGGTCGDFQSSCNIIGAGAQYHQLSWNVVGTLSACSVRVDSSADGVTWNTGDIVAAQTCTSNGNAISTAHTVNYTRINVTSITPVSTATLTVNLTGYANNPVPSGGTVTSVTATSPVASSGGSTPNITCLTCAIGPGSSTANHLAKFSSTDGITLIDGGVAGAGTLTDVGASLPANNFVCGNTYPDTKDCGFSIVPPANGGVYTSATAGQSWYFLPYGDLTLSSQLTLPIGTFTANQVKAGAIHIPARVTFTKETINVTTTANGSHYYIGIYSADGATLLVQGSFTMGAGTGVITATVSSTTLTPGIYYLAWSTDSSTAIVQGTQTNGTAPGAIFNATFNKIGLSSNTTSGGVLPASLAIPLNGTLYQMPDVILEP